MAKVYLEEQRNRVSSFQSTPDNTHYPSEKLVKDSLDSKAEQDGYYETLSAGLADNLIDRKGAGSAQEFTFRTACGTASIADDGSAEIKSLHGKTIVWNQLIPLAQITPTKTKTGITLTNNNDGSITVNGTATEETTFFMRSDDSSTGFYNFVNGHKYLLRCCPVNGSSTSFYGSWTLVGSEYGDGLISTCSANATGYVYFRVKSGVTISNAKFYPQLIDLTAMFGSGNEPSTVAEFKSLFPLDYYAYNAGSLLSFNGTGVKTVGFNQWDEEWEVGRYIIETGAKTSSTNTICSTNKTKVIPSTAYYFKCPANINFTLFYYDANYNFLNAVGGLTTGVFTTPSNAYYVTFTMAASYGTTYNNDICINLSWSGYRNGEYEAYWTQTRSLPVSTYFSDGMKSAGSVYDELTASKAIKRIGKVDLGTLTWTYNSTYQHFSAQLALSKSVDPSSVANAVCNQYKAGSTNVVYYQTSYNKHFCINSSRDIFIRDVSYTDAAAFKTAMSGVYLYYELATTEETTIEPPLNLSYKVADFGTEMLLPENDDEPTTSPLNAVIAYTDDFTRTLATLPKNYDTTDGLDALCSALATTLSSALNGTFTITRGAYDATNKKYAFTCSFTANS